MSDFDEKTQVWLLQTIEIRCASALRGGVETDYRARRQTMASVAVVAAFLLLLLLLPVRLSLSPPAPPRAADAVGRRAATAYATRAATAYATRAATAYATAVAAPPPAAAPLHILPPHAGRGQGGGLPPGVLLPPPGHAAPSVPIGLDGPARAGWGGE